MIVGFSFMMSNIVLAEAYNISEVSKCKVVTDYSRDTSVEEMDTVIFGTNSVNNSKQPMEWIVLEKDGSKALLLSKYTLRNREYNKSDEPVTWETCDLRKYLNNEWYNRVFDNGEKQMILDSVLVNSNLNYLRSKDMITCPNTIDKVFLLSFLEFKTYFGCYDVDEIKLNDNKIVGPVVKFYENARAYGLTSIDEKQNAKEQGWWLRVNTTNKKRAILFQELEDADKDYYMIFDCVRKAPQDFMTTENTTNKTRFGSTFALSDNPTGTKGVRPALWVSYTGNQSSDNNLYLTIGEMEHNSDNKISSGGQIAGLPSRESDLRSDNHFYLDNNMQESTWVYYKTYYYHVDGSGNIQKNQWIELRYVGADGRMYRGRQTPDGKWVGDDGLVVDTSADLSKSLTIEAAEPDSWYKTQSGLWYYFENDRTTTKKGWFTDSRDNQTYYLDPQTGIMAVGWTTINGIQYYFNESHNNELNWYETGGGFYESYNKKVKAYGSMYKNETTPDGKKVDANGRLVN